MAPELLTERLRLRRWRAADEPVIAAINADPDVMRYIQVPAGAAPASVFIARQLAHWETHGFGLWAIESREGAELLGFAGIAYPTFLPELAHRPEIGWRLARRAWGQGLGAEAARACRDDAFQRLALPELIAIIHPDNDRSQRLAARLGMIRAQSVRHPGLGRDVEVWRVDAGAWRLSVAGRSAPPG